MKELGKKIRLLRHQKGWSQEDVAVQLDISIPAFSKIETGITDVNLSRLTQISKIFGLSVIEMLSQENPEEKEKYFSDLDIVNKKLAEKNNEVLQLQKKVIDLYEEIRHFATT